MTPDSPDERQRASVGSPAPCSAKYPMFLGGMMLVNSLMIIPEPMDLFALFLGVLAGLAIGVGVGYQLKQNSQDMPPNEV